MAYDRFDSRDDRSRWQDNRDSDRFSSRDREGRSSRDDRGFFERAGDEISSWFGDEDAERRRHQDRMRDDRSFASRDARFNRGDRDDDRDRDWNQNRGVFARGGSSDRDFSQSWRNQSFGRDREDERFRERGRDYRPMTGDYGRGHESGQFFAASGFGRGERDLGDYDRQGDRSQTPWGRDEYRRTSSAGTSQRERDFDPHYRNWRDRQMNELDRDYDDYRREHQSKFESDFGSWRDRRQQKRGMLGQIREHMEVVGNDDQHVGTVDKTMGDRIILTKSDPESGGAHHSLSCSDIDRVDGDRVILDCSADQARKNWRDESRSRALFEREDSGEMGPRVLDRSFEGTYR